MASIGKLETTKDGRRFWLVRVRMGRNDSTRKTRFYWPEKKNGDPVSESTALNSLEKFAAEFERQCKAGGSSQPGTEERTSCTASSRACKAEDGQAVC